MSAQPLFDESYDNTYSDDHVPNSDGLVIIVSNEVKGEESSDDSTQIIEPEVEKNCLPKPHFIYQSEDGKYLAKEYYLLK